MYLEIETVSGYSEAALLRLAHISLPVSEAIIDCAKGAWRAGDVVLLANGALDIATTSEDNGEILGKVTKLTVNAPL